MQSRRRPHGRNIQRELTEVMIEPRRAHGEPVGGDADHRVLDVAQQRRAASLDLRYDLARHVEREEVASALGVRRVLGRRENLRRDAPLAGAPYRRDHHLSRVERRRRRRAETGKILVDLSDVYEGVLVALEDEAALDL